MKRLILTLSFLLGILSSLNAASFDMKEYRATLLDIEGGFGKISDSPDIMVGSSGVVVHGFSNGESSIVARAVVTEKSGLLATVRFEVFSMLEQKALPLPGILPNKGDGVILNFLYSRALIVAPNEEIYKQVTSSFSNVEFVHPDISGAYLANEFKPNPSRDDFRKICADNAAGVIFIALNGEGVFADCGSFQVLKRFKAGNISYYNVPFYTRVGEIKTMFWDYKNSKISDYERHYKYLLGEDNGR